MILQGKTPKSGVQNFTFFWPPPAAMKKTLTFWEVDARESALANDLDARGFGVDFRQKNDENLGDFGHFLGSRRT